VEEEAEAPERTESDLIEVGIDDTGIDDDDEEE